MPWHMERLTFSDMRKLDAALVAARDARMDAQRPSRQS